MEIVFVINQWCATILRYVELTNDILFYMSPISMYRISFILLFIYLYT